MEEKLRKPVKTYKTDYPKLSKEFEEQFYSCESYHNPCPTCNGTCNSFLSQASITPV